MNPRYRSKAAAYDFDKYSSKGSAIHPVKKMNIHTKVLGACEQVPPAITNGEEGSYNVFVDFIFMDFIPNTFLKFSLAAATKEPCVILLSTYRHLFEGELFSDF